MSLNLFFFFNRNNYFQLENCHNLRRLTNIFHFILFDKTICKISDVISHGTYVNQPTLDMYISHVWPLLVCILYTQGYSQPNSNFHDVQKKRTQSFYYSVFQPFLWFKRLHAVYPQWTQFVDVEKNEANDWIMECALEEVARHTCIHFTLISVIIIHSK